MAITFHHIISLFSFIIGVMWFNVFVVLGLLMRKLKFPIKYSVVPLLLLLVLSILRMFIAIEIPGAVVILSERIYPAIVNFLRYEIVHFRLLESPINIVNTLIFLWITVAIWLAVRYFYDYISKFGIVMNWLRNYERDEHAESILSDIIGSDKRFYVFRNGCFSTAVATAFKPYIILPEVDFTDDELRVILLHEWKHIQDKDYLTGIIINLICCVFWWNPLVYILRRNFRFAQELKSDQFAVSDKKDFHHFLDSLVSLNKAKKDKKMVEYGAVSTFISGDDGLVDRLNILALREDSRGKRILSNVCYSVTFILIFVASYTFTVLPAFWDATDASIISDDFMDEYSESGCVFKVRETFIIDNEDGTFSFYIDGQFIRNIDDSNDAINWFPIHTKEAD